MSRCCSQRHCCLLTRLCTKYSNKLQCARCAKRLAQCAKPSILSKYSQPCPTAHRRYWSTVSLQRGWHIAPKPGKNLADSLDAARHTHKQRSAHCRYWSTVSAFHQEVAYTYALLCGSGMCSMTWPAGGQQMDGWGELAAGGQGFQDHIPSMQHSLPLLDGLRTQLPMPGGLSTVINTLQAGHPIVKHRGSNSLHPRLGKASNQPGAAPRARQSGQWPVAALPARAQCCASPGTQPALAQQAMPGKSSFETVISRPAGCRQHVQTYGLSA